MLIFDFCPPLLPEIVIFFARGNSLSQNLTVLPAPSGREPLALPEALHFSQKLSRHAKGPIPEGAVCAADWGSFGRYPLSHLRCQLSQRESLWRNRRLCNLPDNFPSMPRAPSQRGLSAQQTGGVSADTPSVTAYAAPAPPRGRLCAMPETLCHR